MEAREKYLFFLLVKLFLRKKCFRWKKKRKQELLIRPMLLLSQQRNRYKKFLMLQLNSLTWLNFENERTVWLFERQERWFQEIFDNRFKPEYQKRWREDSRINEMVVTHYISSIWSLESRLTVK